jgi:hypothetical protein
LKHLRKPLNPRDETTDRAEAVREIMDREAVGILIEWPKGFALLAAARETASFLPSAIHKKRIRKNSD